MSNNSSSQIELKITDLQYYNNDVLKQIHEICQEENIPYIGMFGTLLGAVRHKGSIPWDYDVDIAVPVTEMKRFVSVMEEKLPSKYRVDYRKDNNNLRIFPRVGLAEYTTKDLHVDVYPIIGLPDSLSKQKRLFYWIRKVVGIIGAKSYTYTGKKQVMAAVIKTALFFVSKKTLINWYDKLCGLYSYDNSEIIGCSNAASGYKRTFAKSVIENTTLLPYNDFELRVPCEYDKVLTILYGDYQQYPSLEEREAAINKVYTIEKI